MRSHSAGERTIVRSLAVLFFVFFVASAPALLRAGEVKGSVVGPDGKPLVGATVDLTNGLSGYQQTVQVGSDGTFLLYNVPDNPYHLVAQLDGYQAEHADIVVRGAVPVTHGFKLTLAYSASLEVSSAKEPVELETDTSMTHVDIDKSLIRRFPAPVASRAFAALVLSAPGFSQDENGRYHFQGGHSQQLLVIDGQPIGDQIGVTFSNSLDPAIASDMEVVTGGVPAQYGEKATGVINLTTRSALGHPGWQGDVGLGGARDSTLEESANVGWGTSRFGLFANVDHSSSDRFLDPVSFDNFHNQGATRRGFLRLDRLSADGSDSYRLTASGGHTDRDVTNLPSQQATGQNQTVTANDWNLNFGIQHIASSTTVAEAQIYGRGNRLQLFGSPGDSPVTASQNRSLDNRGINGSIDRTFGSHEIKAGVEWKQFPIRESFRFGITDPGFNDPAAEGYNPNLTPYDLTRGGALFTFHGAKTGDYGAAYLQDTLRFGGFTANVGLRYGHNQLFQAESELQPRVGLAYFLESTHTVFRASYDRMFITPEYENILLSSSPQAASLVPPDVAANNLLGFGRLYNVSERHDVYDVGIQQGIGTALRLDVDYWVRDVKNAADQDQFFNTGIVFPLNFRGGRLNGWNARLDFGPRAGVRGYLSVGHVHALYVPPFVGGLFLDSGALDSLTGGPFLIDHDQDIQEQLGLFWDIPRSGFWLGLTQRYDSGLVADAGTLADVLSSSDTSFAAPYLRFGSDPQRIKSRTIWSLSLGARLERYHVPLEVQVDVLNVTDTKGLYNFQSVFGGTHVIPPRTLAARIRYTF